LIAYRFRAEVALGIASLLLPRLLVVFV